MQCVKASALTLLLHYCEIAQSDVQRLDNKDVAYTKKNQMCLSRIEGEIIPRRQQSHKLFGVNGVLVYVVPILRWGRERSLYHGSVRNKYSLHKRLPQFFQKYISK